MAYTEPPSVTTGELMEAADWNTYERANMIALYSGEMSLASQAANDLPYATSATQWARIPAAASAVLVTSGASVPSLSTTLPSGLAIPSPTFSGTLGGTYSIGGTPTVTVGLTFSAASAPITLTGVTRPEIFASAQDLYLSSNSSIIFGIDKDATTTGESFIWRTNDATSLMTLTEAGLLTVVGGLTLTAGTLGGTYAIGGTPTVGVSLTWSAAQNLNSQALTNVNIDSGTIDGATITGATIAGAAPATPTANVLYADLQIKAWAYITEAGGAPTLADDVNVGSITDDGVGDWTVNFATTLPSTYAVTVTCLSTGAAYHATHGATAVGSIRIRMWDAGGGIADAGISVMCVG